MTKTEYIMLLNWIAAQKIHIEHEDNELAGEINTLQSEIKKQPARNARVKEWDEIVRQKKHRRFNGLKAERESLCEEIQKRTNFQGNLVAVYTRAEDSDLRGTDWAAFMLRSCGASPDHS